MSEWVATLGCVSGRSTLVVACVSTSMRETRPSVYPINRFRSDCWSHAMQESVGPAASDAFVLSLKPPKIGENGGKIVESAPEIKY